VAASSGPPSIGARAPIALIIAAARAPVGASSPSACRRLEGGQVDRAGRAEQQVEQGEGGEGAERGQEGGDREQRQAADDGPRARDPVDERRGEDAAGQRRHAAQAAQPADERDAAPQVGGDGGDEDPAADIGRPLRNCASSSSQMPRASARSPSRVAATGARWRLVHGSSLSPSRVTSPPSPRRRQPIGR
jgi:hypothetical protein